MSTFDWNLDETVHFPLLIEHQLIQLPAKKMLNFIGNGMSWNFYLDKVDAGVGVIVTVNDGI